MTAHDPDRERPTPLDPAKLPGEAWSTTVRIPFGRCDAAGIVFTPRYFDMFVEVEELWYEEALGFTLKDLVTERRIGLGYAEASSEFFLPSSMGDRLRVTPLVERVGRSSFTVVFHVVADGRERARGRLVSVATCLDSGSAVPLPDDVRSALVAYQARCDPTASRTASASGR